MSYRWILVVVAIAARVSAQPLVGQPTSDQDVKPWAVGVVQAEQAAALQLYGEGNAEFQAEHFDAALTKYSEALKHWDHPAIHFNMTVCLINLDRPLEAKDHLEKALRFGEEPLGHAMYSQGLTYRHSLDGQIARVKIVCAEPGTVVSLDGASLFTGPGETDRFLMPGRHQIVATKVGYLTVAETLELQPARLTKYDVHLIALKSAAKLTQRWATWKPWTVVAVGAGVAGLGGISHAVANHDFNTYDSNIEMRCPHGCNAAMATQLTDLDSIKHHGYIAQDIAFSLYGVGAAIVITGVIGLVLNRPHTFVDAVPSITPTSGGATLSVGWSL